MIQYVYLSGDLNSSSMSSFKLPFSVLVAAYMLALVLSGSVLFTFAGQAQVPEQPALGDYPLGSTNMTNSGFSMDDDIATDDSGASLLTYDNGQYGIKVHYPNSWSYQEYNPTSDLTAFNVASFFPPVEQDPDLSSELRMTIENLNSPMSVDEYSNDSINYYTNNNENFSLISQSTTDEFLSGMPAYELVFTDYSDGSEYTTYEKGTIDNMNNKVYYLTFKSPTTAFDQMFNPVVNNMIDTFELEPISDTASLDEGGDDLEMFPQDGISNLDQFPLPSQDLNLQDLELFMEGFASSIFNGSSVLATVGTSMVDGIKVTGVSLEDDRELNSETGSLDNSSQHLTVIMSGFPADGQSGGGGNSSVTVIATRIPIDVGNALSSLAGLGPASSSENGLSSFMGEEASEFSSLTSSPFSTGNGNATESPNPFAFLSSLQIGSSSLVNPDWSTPQSVSMSLMGNFDGAHASGTKSGNFSSSLDVIIATVIPYTGNDGISG